jgi:hypothetical protein
MSLVDELLTRINNLPEQTKAELTAKVSKEMPIWFPNAGPQARAYFCPANTLLYGGQGGGGKTDLELGLAFTAHKRTLVLRRHYVNLTGIIDRALAVHGTRDGFNGSAPPRLTTKDGRLIQFSGCQHLGDEQNWMGIPFDLKCFDEATQFLEQQVRLHMGWLRTTEEGQRCRSVLATNPPLEATGDWVIGMFRPWLDLTHPKPAQHGELRWFVTTPDGMDKEVDGAEPIEIDGQVLRPTSRTFIPARLADNPYLVRTDYQTQLDALPEPIRSAVRDGNFMAARKDADFQVIPTEWVIAAQARWKPDGWKDWGMTSIGFDPAGGGRDSAELAARYGNWYAQIVSVQGKETADGSAAAATIIKHRRDGAAVVVDVGGGYGGAVTLRLKDNGIVHIGFNGAMAGVGRTKDRQLGFVNKRAVAWWTFREALNPDQVGGSLVALPPDPELRADLASPTYEVAQRGILIESKEELRKRLGRSPGKGDAVVMAWSEGNAAIRRGLVGPNASRVERPQFATVGYAGQKRRRMGVEAQNRR